MNKSPNISQVLTTATATVMAAAAAASTARNNFTKASTFYVLSQDQPPAKIRYALHIENEIIFVYPFVVVLVMKCVRGYLILIKLSLSLPLHLSHISSSAHNIVGCFVVLLFLLLQTPLSLLMLMLLCCCYRYSLNLVDPTTKLEKLFTNRLPRERFSLLPFELIYCGFVCLVGVEWSGWQWCNHSILNTYITLVLRTAPRQMCGPFYFCLYHVLVEECGEIVVFRRSRRILWPYSFTLVEGQDLSIIYTYM